MFRQVREAWKTSLTIPSTIITYVLHRVHRLSGLHSRLHHAVLRASDGDQIPVIAMDHAHKHARKPLHALVQPRETTGYEEKLSVKGSK
jgi:hypothetical protein